MRQTISNNRVLTLFLGLALPVAIGGCVTVAEQKTETTLSGETPVVATAPAVAPSTAAKATPPATTAPIEKKTQTPATIVRPQVPVPTTTNDPTTLSEATAVASEPGEQIAEGTDAAPASLPYDNNLWKRIRAGLRLEKIDATLTRQHEQWFMENVEFREAMFDRSKLYLYYIVEEVEKRGMPMEIALLPAIESAYKPYAYSRAKASGLWQFMPSTGRLYGLKTNWWYDGRRDVIASTRAALDYLQKLYSDFGDWHLALAAYNAGEGRIGRAIESNRRKGLGTDFVHLKQLKAETKHYVPKLMAMVNIVTDPQSFGIQLPDIPNEPYFIAIETHAQVDLGVIARLTEMEVDQLHFINPGYTRWATDPNGPHKLLIPVNKKDVLLAGLSNLAEHERVQWVHHEVNRGDTLYSIARRYNLTVDAIASANKLPGGLRVGQSLLLPLSTAAKIPQPVVAGTTKAIRLVAKSGQPIVHKVRPGETLSSIARRYNVMVHQLAEWNIMQANDVLQLGRKLKVWTSDGPQA